MRLRLRRPDHLRSDDRDGDRAELAIIELVDNPREREAIEAEKKRAKVKETETAEAAPAVAAAPVQALATVPPEVRIGSEAMISIDGWLADHRDRALRLGDAPAELALNFPSADRLKIDNVIPPNTQVQTAAQQAAADAEEHLLVAAAVEPLRAGWRQRGRRPGRLQRRARRRRRG